MRKAFLSVLILFISITIATDAAGMGVNPAQLPPPEPAGTSPSAVQQPDQKAPEAVKERPEKLPEAGPAIPTVAEPVKQVPRGQIPAEVKPEQKQTETARPKAQIYMPTPGTVSFFFDDADIFEVAQTVFGDILKVNYIIDPKVTGRVNFRTVTPIPRGDVLSVMEIILRLNGIGFLEEEGLYRIVPLPDVSKELIYSQVGKDPEKVAMEMFTFKNVNLKDSMKDIENAIGLSVKGGKIRVLPIFRLNALLVVASTNEQLDYVRKWVGAFDKIFNGARPKVYVYSVQNSKAKDVANILQEIFLGAKSSTSLKTGQPSPQSMASPAQPTGGQPAISSSSSVSFAPSGGVSLVSEITRIFPDEVANSIIILATPEDYELISGTIKEIDVAPRQVVIEGLLVRVDLTDNLSFGLSWSLNTDVNITNIRPFKRDINLSGNVANVPGGTLDNSVGNGFTFVGTDPSGNVRARLTAALKDSRAKILASPHIIVSDNREARIQVGSQVPIATSTTTTPLSGGTNTATNTSTSTIQYKDIGIILKVKPQVNDSGLVSLELAQEVSSLGDLVKIAGQDFQSINKTEATTNLVAQDGETIIIGGLIREDAAKSKEGIPLLSKIPIIGALFSNTTDNSTRTELVILLTPHVVRNQTEAGNVTSEYINRLRDLNKDIIKKGSDLTIKDKDQNKDLQPQAPKN